MQTLLEQFLTESVFAFVLLVVRMGTAFMIMPGIGDSFVSARVRLHITLALCFVLYPLLMPYVPSPMPSTFGLFTLIIMEFIIGLFFGTVARIFMVALDTAGMVISTASGLGNAQLFNPSLASQGSLVGAFLSMTGVTFLLVTNMHHILIMGVMESYELFPLGAVPDTGSMAQFMSHSIGKSFEIGVRFAAPFLVLTTVLYVGMGVLTRLMPQIQVFILTLPIQILISVIALMMILGTAMVYWLTSFEKAMFFFFSAIGA